MVSTNGNVMEIGMSNNAWQRARLQRVATAVKRGVVKNTKFTRGQASSRKMHDGFTRRLNLMTKYQRYLAIKKRKHEQDQAHKTARASMLKIQREHAKATGIPFAGVQGGVQGVVGRVKSLFGRLRNKLGV